MRRFVLGDVHGNIEALRQVLDRAPIDREEDQLIFLGDVADGHDHTYQCVEELLTFENLIAIKGNHDHWTEQWMKHGHAPYLWLSQGGRETVQSYDQGVPDSHVDYFSSTLYYYISDDNKLFVHGGFDPYKGFRNTPPHEYMWEREHAYKLLKGYVGGEMELDGFDEMFIGHTNSASVSLEPIHSEGVWLLDQGAGYDGRLTLMDVDTKEYWQSDEGWKGGR